VSDDDLLNPRIAERLTRAARAAQTLSETLWEAFHEELIDPRPRRVAELSQRLADVAQSIASLSRVDATAQSPPTDATPRAEGAEGAGGPDRPAERRPPAMAEQRSPVAAAEPASHLARAESGSESGSYDAPPPLGESSTAPRPPSIALLVDELAPDARPPEQAPPAPEPHSREPSAALHPPIQVPPEIEIRDERGEEFHRERVRGEAAGEGPTAWIASIGRRLERYERDGMPFAVLLLELADVERLRHTELPGEVARLTGLVEIALAGELRPADTLTRESPGRYWLLAPETDSSSARSLAGRLAEAVRRAASHRGAPLELAAGIAVCPADGSQAATLAAHADIALYAARASGRPVV
jgi:GGDEF domain-containing protein